MLRRIIAIFLCFSFAVSQSGFAQIVEMPGGVAAAAIPLRTARDTFRPIHLRSLAYDGTGTALDVLVDTGDGKALIDAATSQAQAGVKYFLIGITLSNDIFWVNLRPDSSARMIDPSLALTDLGKVLLEADLQLKKDVAAYTAPGTGEGRVYWDRIYKKAEELFGAQAMDIPTLCRPWIVPGEIIVRESGNSAYIYKATLKVMLEHDYVKGAQAYDFKDERQRKMNEYASQQMRELIIPKITREVNSAKRYAALRQVYYSLILAAWFKDKFRDVSGEFARRIDCKDLKGLMSEKDWEQDTYFQAYKKSFEKGEYSVRENITAASGPIVRNYFSGGISFALSGGETGILSKIKDRGIAGHGANMPGGEFLKAYRITFDGARGGIDAQEIPRQQRTVPVASGEDIRQGKESADGGEMAAAAGRSVIGWREINSALSGDFAKSEVERIQGKEAFHLLDREGRSAATIISTAGATDIYSTDQALIGRIEEALAKNGTEYVVDSPGTEVKGADFPRYFGASYPRKLRAIAREDMAAIGVRSIRIFPDSVKAYTRIEAVPAESGNRQCIAIGEGELSLNPLGVHNAALLTSGMLFCRGILIYDRAKKEAAIAHVVDPTQELDYVKTMIARLKERGANDFTVLVTPNMDEETQQRIGEYVAANGKLAKNENSLPKSAFGFNVDTGEVADIGLFSSTMQWDEVITAIGALEPDYRRSFPLRKSIGYLAPIDVTPGVYKDGGAADSRANKIGPKRAVSEILLDQARLRGQAIQVIHPVEIYAAAFRGFPSKGVRLLGWGLDAVAIELENNRALKISARKFFSSRRHNPAFDTEIIDQGMMTVSGRNVYYVIQPKLEMTATLADILKFQDRIRPYKFTDIAPDQIGFNKAVSRWELVDWGAVVQTEGTFAPVVPGVSAAAVMNDEGQLKKAEDAVRFIKEHLAQSLQRGNPVVMRDRDFDWDLLQVPGRFPGMFFKRHHFYPRLMFEAEVHELSVAAAQAEGHEVSAGGFSLLSLPGLIPFRYCVGGEADGTLIMPEYQPSTDPQDIHRVSAILAENGIIARGVNAQDIGIVEKNGIRVPVLVNLKKVFVTGKRLDAPTGDGAAQLRRDGGDATVGKYLDDIKAGTESGNIMSVPHENSLAARYSHLPGAQGGEISGLQHDNTRGLSENGSRVLDIVMRGKKGSRVLDVGAGAGKACSDMYIQAREAGKEIGIEMIGLTPVAPRFLLHFSWEEMAAQARRFFIEPSSLPLSFAFSLQAQGIPVFEVTKSPFIQREYIGEFLDPALPLSGQFEFIYDSFGGVYYSSREKNGLRRALDKSFALMSGESIFLCECLSVAPMRELLQGNGIPDDLVGFISVADSGLMFFKKQSSHYDRVKTRLPSANQVANNLYMLDDFEGLLNILAGKSADLKCSGMADWEVYDLVTATAKGDQRARDKLERYADEFPHFEKQVGRLNLTRLVIGLMVRNQKNGYSRDGGAQKPGVRAEEAMTRDSHAQRSDRDVGGIDFRSLPLNSMRAKIGLTQDGWYSASATLNLGKEWRRIAKMLSCGLRPSAFRIGEFVAACTVQGEIGRYTGALLAGIAGMLRADEENGAADDGLRELLVFLEETRA